MKLALVAVIASACSGGATSQSLDAGFDPPAQLMFLRQPASAGVNAVIVPQVVVIALDAQGSGVQLYDGTVELSLAANAANATLGGTVEVQFSDGIATFYNLVVSTAGVGYQLVASSATVPGTATSDPFDVTAAASTTRSTFALDPSGATADGLASISAVVTALDDAGAPMPGQPVHVAMTGSGADVFPSHGTTNDQGQFSTTLRSITPGAATATATIGSISLTASASFAPPACTLLFPGLPTMQHETMPVGATTADFDHDGRSDVAIVDGSSMQVLRGMGDGRLHAPDLYNAFGATAVVSGDFDADGYADLAVAASRDVFVFPNLGTGQFGSATDVSLPAAARAIAVGDLDGDGKLDLVVDGIDYTAGASAIVLLGNGDGSFASPVVYPLDGTSQSEWGSIAIADVDGDGHDDVVIADPSGQFSVLHANADGTLQPEIDTPARYKQGTIGVADFNHDDKLDIAFANGSGGLHRFRER
jgi:Bacterial Ig-like domain (group 1)/FG-GAP-like repeat